MSNNGAGSDDSGDISISESTLRSLMDEELSCPICLDVLHDVLVTECLHRFCEECIRRFFVQIDSKSSHECPLCRSHIKSIRTLRRDHGMDKFIAAFSSKVVDSRNNNDFKLIKETPIEVVKAAAREHKIRTEKIIQAQQLKRTRRQISGTSEAEGFYNMINGNISSKPYDLDSSNWMNESSSNSSHKSRRHKTSYSSNSKPDVNPFDVITGSEMSANALSHFEDMDYHIDFDLIRHPIDKLLSDLSHIHIRCKGLVSLATVKKLIISQLKIRETTNDIELSVSLPVDGISSVFSLEDDELTLADVLNWCRAKVPLYDSLVLLYRRK